MPLDWSHLEPDAVLCEGSVLQVLEVDLSVLHHLHEGGVLVQDQHVGEPLLTAQTSHSLKASFSILRLNHLQIRELSYWIDKCHHVVFTAFHFLVPGLPLVAWHEGVDGAPDVKDRVVEGRGDGQLDV